MFLDNATSHRHLKLSNVKLDYFPPYFTSKLQPVDLRMIRALKARDWKFLMRCLLVIKNLRLSQEEHSTY